MPRHACADHSYRLPLRLVDPPCPVVLVMAWQDPSGLLTGKPSIEGGPRGLHQPPPDRSGGPRHCAMRDVVAALASLRVGIEDLGNPIVLRFADRLLPLSARLGPSSLKELLRWSPFVGQLGGLDKLGSGFRQAANLVTTSAPYASSGVLPSRPE